MTIGSSQDEHDAFHTLVLSAADSENGVTLTATEDNTEFVLVCPNGLTTVHMETCTSFANEPSFRLRVNLWTSLSSNMDPSL